MIQLASDPNASRVERRPVPAERKDASLQARRRAGHAWPFISRYADKPVAQQAKRPSSDHGS